MTDIIQGKIYAVTKGTLLGSNLVIIETDEDNIHTLNLPDMVNVSVTREEFTTGIDNDILELLESLPDDIINVCIKQHEKNTSTGQQ